MTDGDRFRMLLSYHYAQRWDMAEILARYFPPDDPPELFLDSGAFSAKTQGAEIDVRAYGRWLVANAGTYWCCSNLDVIGDGVAAADGTWKNQQILEDEFGLHPVPVFHAGEPWSALERILNAGHGYVALGGLVGRPIVSVMPWLVQCFKMARGVAVFHGFGLTAWEPFKALPWYSIDSSSWGSGYRFGYMRLFDPRTRREARVQMFDPTSVYRHADLIRRLGGDPDVFASREAYHRRHACAVAGAVTKEAERYLQQLHGPVPLPDQPDRHGLRWYVADTAPANLSVMAAGLRLYLADTNVNDLAAAAGHHQPQEAPQ